MPDIQKVRTLLNHGATVNAKTETERTALLVAASYPRTSGLLRLLLERGADLRAQDRGGATALSLAIRSADIDVVQFLVDRGLDPTALAYPARRAGFARYDLPTTDYLMSKARGAGRRICWVRPPRGSPPSSLPDGSTSAPTSTRGGAAQYGRTALMNAVASEAEGADTVRLLLEHGADPNAKMTEGETPLDWAIYKGDRAKIAVLEQHGAMRGNGPRREEIAPPAPGGIADPNVSLTKKRRAAAARRAQVPRQDLLHFLPSQRDCPSMAAPTARRKGIAIDDALDAQESRRHIDFFKRMRRA